MNRRLRQILCAGRGTAFLLLALVLHGKAAAENLKTNSGRIYKDATILRADSGGLVIVHKFGVVKIPLSDISPESRDTFNPAAALEAARQTRSQQHQRAAERESERAERMRQQKAITQRAGVEVDEQNQAEAEALAARLQRRRSEKSTDHRTSQRYHLRGEIIGLGSDYVLVLCEADGGMSRVKQELAKLRDSPFSAPTPTVREVLVVTGMRKSLADGDTVDVSVQPAGKRTNLRTRSGDSYSGQFRVFHAVE